MSIWRKFLKDKKTSQNSVQVESPQQQTSIKVADEDNSSQWKNWYFAASKDGKIRQIVVSLPTSFMQPTELETLIMRPELFPTLTFQTWCAGMLRIDSQPQPVLIVRMSSFAKDTRSISKTLSFSFCNTLFGNLFHMVIRVESDSFGEGVRKKITTLPPIKPAIAEWIVSMDSQYDVEMISDIFSQSKIKLIVCEDSLVENAITFGDGSKKMATWPNALYEIDIPLDKSLAYHLKNEFQSLIDQHRTLSSDKNSQIALEEFSKSVPIEVDPIFPNPIYAPPPVVFTSIEQTVQAQKRLNQLTQILIYVKGANSFFQVSDSLACVLEEMSGLPVDTLIEKIGRLFAVNKADKRVDDVSQGIDCSLYAAAQLSLDLKDEEFASRFAKGELKTSYRYHADPESGLELAVFLFYDILK